jgi:hypothetical protein
MQLENKVQNYPEIGLRLCGPSGDIVALAWLSFAAQSNFSYPLRPILKFLQPTRQVPATP